MTSSERLFREPPEGIEIEIMGARVGVNLFNDLIKATVRIAVNTMVRVVVRSNPTIVVVFVCGLIAP